MEVNPDAPSSEQILYANKLMEEQRQLNEARAKSKDAARETKFTLEKEMDKTDDKRVAAKNEQEKVIEKDVVEKEPPKKPFGIA